MKRLPFLIAAVCICSFLNAALCAEDMRSVNSNAENLEFSASPVLLYGAVSNYYTFRSVGTPGGSFFDHDLAQNLMLNVRFPSSNLFEFNVVGAFLEDLDGYSESTDAGYFKDNTNLQGSPVFSWYLYEANLGINDALPFLKNLKIGRISGFSGEPIYYDGLSVKTEWIDRFTVSAFGGLAYHPFEDNTAWWSDWLVGGSVNVFPIDNGVIGADYLFVSDEKNLNPALTTINHLLSFDAKFYIRDLVRTSVEMQLLNWSVRKAGLMAVTYLPASDLEFLLSYYMKLDTVNDLTTEFLLYHELFSDSQSSHNIDAKVRKLFGQNVAADVGLYIRAPLGGEDIIIFNQSFAKLYLVLGVDDLFVDGLFLSVNGDFWFGTDKNYISFGLDGGYKFSRFLKNAKINIGTYLNLYKFPESPYTETDSRETVPAFYVKLRIPIIKQFLLEGGYELEANPGLSETFHDLKVGVRYVF